MKINNVHDLYQKVVGDKKKKSRKYYMARIYKEIYNSTNCCVWISCDSQGIHMGSIVKGWEEEAIADVLPWGCDSEEFGKALNWVETEVDKFWDRKWRSTLMVDEIMEAYLANSDCDWIINNPEVEESIRDLLKLDHFDRNPLFKWLAPWDPWQLGPGGFS